MALASPQSSSPPSFFYTACQLTPSHFLIPFSLLLLLLSTASSSSTLALSSLPSSRPWRNPVAMSLSFSVAELAPAPRRRVAFRRAYMARVPAPLWRIWKPVISRARRLVCVLHLFACQGCPTLALNLGLFHSRRRESPGCWVRLSLVRRLQSGQGVGMWGWCRKRGTAKTNITRSSVGVWLDHPPRGGGEGYSPSSLPR